MKRDYRTAMLVDTTNTVAVAVPTTADDNDEHSISSDCSTIAVISAKQQQPVVPRSALSTQQRRRVHFNEACNVVVYPTQQPQATDSSTWYSEAELRQFKAQTYAIAREIHRLEGKDAQAHAERTFTAVVAAAYDACQRAPCETTTSPLMSQQAQRLQKWMRVGDSRWGLERTAVRPVAADRRQRRTGIVHAVLELQEMLAFRTLDYCNDEVLAKTAEIWSRPSRLFARELAVAAAAAV